MNLPLTFSSRLHKEIADFFDFVKPYDYEEVTRRALIQRVEDAARQAPMPNAHKVSIECFGSFAAGLYLPTADMDLVAISPPYRSFGQRTFAQTATAMYKLANSLQSAGVAAPGGVAVISKARVPIVKFADRDTGIKVDISFENDSGLKANKTFEQWKAQYPAMPVVVVLVKQLLAMRGLNEVFTGGIGGFTIICLVVSMMQLMPELQLGQMDPHVQYGNLLLNFLDLYGNKFDVVSTGISFNPPGYFDKIKHPRSRGNPKRLTIIDPNNRDNDISGGSARIFDVLDLFRDAHHKLQRRLAQVHSGVDARSSVLRCILGGNYTQFIHQREKLSLLHRGYGVSPPPPPPPPAPLPLKKGKAKNQNKPNKKQKQKALQQGQAFVPQAQPSMPAPKHALPSRPSAPTQKPASQTGYGDSHQFFRDA